MKNINNILLLAAFAILSSVLSSCDKDPYFIPGDYRYEQRDLTYMENFDGILVHWGDNVTDEQKEAVREIAASMVRVDGGTFNMGCDDEYANADEAPVHSVTLSDYRIAKFTITQKQWSTIMGYELNWNPSVGVGDDYPATLLSMQLVDEFINKLNALSDLHFRKPTEAEWEYAAKGGKMTHGYRFSGSDNPDMVAWHKGNAAAKIHPVGMLPANELGLYDMSGNVWEWCEDQYAPYTAANQTNPVVQEGEQRVVRGGSISYEAVYSRTTQRYPATHYVQSFNIGLRLAMSCN